MKINANGTITKSNAVGTTTDFKIKTSATAFKILSEGLYSNKIGSMIRELICNAYDAHCAAGTKDTPIDVELPMVTNPLFRIRDYGTGLSESDMQTIYTTYFESTKSGDNKYIGGFGLGSKTPLCYNTEQFFVTSYFNRMKYVYNVSIGETGAPVLTKWDECMTDEPNGLELLISVDINDVELFKTEFYKFLIWTDIKINRIGYENDFARVGYRRILPLADVYNPLLDNLIGDSTIPFCVHDYACVAFEADWDTKTACMVRVGEVAYFAEYQKFFDAYDKIVPDYVNDILAEAERVSGVSSYNKENFIISFFGYPDKLKDFVKYIPPICLQVNIGDVEVTASREDISYTDATMRSLSVKLFGFLCGCALKTMELTAQFMESGDPAIYLDNRIITAYVKYRFLAEIATNTDELLFNNTKHYDLARIRKLFKQITDGFDITLNMRLNNTTRLFDQTQHIRQRVRPILEMVKGAEAKTRLVEGHNIKICNLDTCVFRKTDDNIWQVSFETDASYWSQVLDGNINVVVSRLKPAGALEMPYFEQMGIDTTGNTIYLWVGVTSKIAGERLIEHLNAANQLPNRLLNFKIVSFLERCDELAYKPKSVARKVPCCLYSCKRDANHKWEVSEKYQPADCDCVSEMLKKGETVYVLPVYHNIKTIRNSVQFFEEKLPFLLNLLSKTETKALIAVVPDTNCIRFKEQYTKIGKGKVLVMTDTANWLGDALLRARRHNYFVLSPFGTPYMDLVGLLEKNPSDGIFSWEQFFIKLCLEETPHLKRRTNLFTKMLKAFGITTMKEFYYFEQIMSIVDLPEIQGRKFDLMKEVYKIIDRVSIKRLNEIARDIETLKLHADYQITDILVPALQRIIKRLLDNIGINS